ncbi:MAG: geranylgeranylglycerol-phosphate geranylgeranyltransferase [Bacteroidota bacterium]|nr:geranylgeranylglycerol-phosphate geranylgeranyltransferase [Bacteroidota bacterium]MDX5404380.1 geranylgeranylglycerol-phosphate geranylgeranyltransferase [Bacteroidota bacterium]MDX5426645.1 geranylgeranylglycerol-phosphate geranylgeranyltransferase [Bacteroidota bacterium]MDX5447064.1 geranylgeranylglycerol-phosphate geranylgeranyltransferase [Bacteroidota bacterium]MDX5504653.1 geranylgeranylglycerol-phosphate geranylgeranyltransferase [Bacteroidota bacterium]
MSGKISHYLQLIRWPNLTIMALIYLLFRYGFLDLLGIEHALSGGEYLLLTLSVLSVAAAGYVINDLYDQRADRINKPDKLIIGRYLREKQAQNAYYFFSVLGVGLGIFVGYQVGMYNLGLIHALSILLLYFYATQLKRQPIIGNLIISLLAFSVLMIIPLFDLLPVMDSGNKDVLFPFFNIFLAYGTFSFFITLAREIIKDLEDVKGDREAGYQTFAVIAPLWANKLLVFISLTLILIGFFLFLLMSYRSDFISFGYVLAFLLTPSLYLVWLTTKASEKDDYHKLSLGLKVLMVLGIFSVLVFSLAFQI